MTYQELIDAQIDQRVQYLRNLQHNTQSEAARIAGMTRQQMNALAKRYDIKFNGGENG